MNICILAGRIHKVTQAAEPVCKFEIETQFRTSRGQCGMTIVPCVLAQPSKDVLKLLRGFNNEAIRVEANGRINSRTRLFSLRDSKRKTTIVLDPRATFFRTVRKNV